METLLINAHPDFKSDDHFSNRLEKQFIETYHQRFGNEGLTVLNLYDEMIPRIEDGQLWTVWQKQAADQPLNDSEKIIAKRSNELLDQFIASHRIVISTPLHNFYVTSRLKDYLDNILIAKKTFRYLDQPLANGKSSTGLLNADYRAMMLQASGSIYSADNFYQHLDFAPKYLHAMFMDVMGFDQFELVRAEGTATESDPVIMNQAFSQLKKSFDEFYA